MTQVDNSSLAPNRACFDRLQIERSILMPQLPHVIRGSVLQLEVLGQAGNLLHFMWRRIFSFQPHPDAVVRELRAVVNATAIDIAADHVPLGIGGDVDDDGNAIFVLVQRREIRG